MKISFAKPGLPRAGVIVISVFARRELSPSGNKLDKQLDHALSRAMRASTFKGNKGQLLGIMTPSRSRLDRVILIGLGKASDINELEMEKVGSRIYKETYKDIGGKVAVAVDPISNSKLNAAHMAAHMAFGARLESYRFDKYKTKQKESEKPILISMIIHCSAFLNARSKLTS